MEASNLENTRTPWLDDPLMPVAQFLGELSGIDGSLEDDFQVQGMSITALQLDLPVELRVEIDAAGRLQVLGCPPTQRTETTILPVFHRMKLHMVRDDAE